MGYTMGSGINSTVTSQDVFDEGISIPMSTYSLDQFCHSRDGPYFAGSKNIAPDQATAVPFLSQAFSSYHHHAAALSDSGTTINHGIALSDSGYASVINPSSVFGENSEQMCNRFSDFGFQDTSSTISTNHQAESWNNSTPTPLNTELPSTEKANLEPIDTEPRSTEAPKLICTGCNKVVKTKSHLKYASWHHWL
jgi:hypothetical protein